ncbi:MAG: hypothetical protein AAGA38_07085 [Pseudomonadota bacterium]
MPYAEIAAFVVFVALMSGFMDNSQPLLTEHIVDNAVYTSAEFPATTYPLPTAF